MKLKIIYIEQRRGLYELQAAEFISKISVLTMLQICCIEDIKNKQIHIKWLAGFAAEGLLCWIFIYRYPVFQITASVFPGFVMLMLAYVSRGSIGTGDGLLIMAAGIFLGAACITRILIYAVLLSAVWALFLYVIKKKDRKYEMPFVPFLFISFIIELILEYCCSNN